MIYEMRQYLVARGRMDDNHQRMKLLPALLAKHKITVVGRWVALAGARMPMFIYIMEWKDFAEREAAWGAFYADPEWTYLRGETNAGSELIEGNELSFLRPNAIFQQEEADPHQTIGGVHQLLMQNFAVGQNAAVNEFLSSTYLPRIKHAGAHVIGVLDVISGANMPRVAMLFAWKDVQAWHSGWQRFQSDPAIVGGFATQRNQLGSTLFTASDTWLLEPASYLPPFSSLRTEPR